MFNGSVSKFLTALFGVIASGLTTYYGTARWEPIVVMGLTALGVYLIPNTSWVKQPNTLVAVPPPTPPNQSTGV